MVGCSNRELNTSEMIADVGRFDASPSRMTSNKQQQVRKEVAVKSAAATYSLVSQKLPPSSRVVPPAVAAGNIGDVQRVSNAMAGDHDMGRKRRVLILMSDTGGGHRASAEVGQDATNYLCGLRHVCHLAG